jgi:dienelactone hydrolase
MLTRLVTTIMSIATIATSCSATGAQQAVSPPHHTVVRQPAGGQGQYYDEDISTSDPIRTEQARELDSYVEYLRHDDARMKALFTPDYSSVSAYEASAKRLRKKFAESIGYPPPGAPGPEQAVFTRIGEDAIGIYYRVRIPVLPGVHSVGIYIEPKQRVGRVPLIISMHGGGGSPEIALFHGGSNYHDMVRGGVKRGFAVFAPTHLFNAKGYPGDIRNRIDSRLRLVGTSLTAIEIYKIAHALDVLLKRPEVDPRKVAMVGLSYGGYYTLVTTALEPRIKAAVSSCYFGVQEGRYGRDELTVPSDFQFMDRFSLLQDPEIVALICPRPLEIQAGSSDDYDHREPGRQIAPRAAEYYNQLGRSSDFRFLVFEGGHEFNDASAWEFLKQHGGF